MSLAATRLSLIHLCTIERNVNEDTEDALGQPSPPGWAAHLTDVPCRTWASSGRETVNADTAASVVVVEEVHLIVPLGTDVTERDRIASVTYRGETTQAGPLGVRAVLTRPDHIELVLVKVG